MASQLRLITSHILTRSFRPTSVSSASRFLSINADAVRGSYTTMPVDEFIDESWVKSKYPKISSFSFEMEMNDEERSVTIDIPRLRLFSDITLNLQGLKKEEMRPCAEYKTLFVQGKTHSAGIKEEMKKEPLEVTPLNKAELRTNIMANLIANILSSFRDISAKRCWPYYDMFNDRSILGEGFCPIIATIKSFSIYKEEDAESIEIKMSVPGLSKMKLTTQGLRVSLDMCDLKREDVKIFFDYDTLFIEGKTKKKHYITCIHLPEDIHIKHNMIQKCMKKGFFYAFLPCVKNKENKMN